MTRASWQYKDSTFRPACVEDLPYNEGEGDLNVDAKKEKEIQGETRERVEDLPPIAESNRQVEENPADKQEQNLEVESIVTKIEKKMARIPKGAPGAQDDQVVVQQPASQQPPIQLPVTKQGMAKGQKAPVELSIKWLVVWAIRQIKMWTKLGRKVELAKLPEVQESPTGNETKEE